MKEKFAPPRYMVVLNETADDLEKTFIDFTFLQQNILLQQHDETF